MVAYLPFNGSIRPLLKFDGITSVVKRSSAFAICRSASSVEFKLQLARGLVVT